MNDTGALRPFRPATPKVKPKVLVELRNCSIPFAGISQETRLVYSVLSSLPTLELGGLLNPFHDLVLPRSVRSIPAVTRSKSHIPWKAMFKQSRLVSALDWEIQGVRRNSIVYRLWKRLNKRDVVPALYKYFYHGKKYNLLDLDTELFGDFVWTRYFQQTLPAQDRQRIVETQFYAIEKGWRDAHFGCRDIRTAAKINTKTWDIFLCQMPTPFIVSPSTKTVVRYHDSIPIFLPHTVDGQENKRFFLRLRASVRNGAFFVCTSEPVRRELVRLFPQTETNSSVIPDIVSDGFYKDTPSQETVGDIIYRRKCMETAPRKVASSRPKSVKEPYIVSVSTMEPRKNYGMLLQAWAVACSRLETRPLLVLVANLGWRHHEDVQELKALVKSGRVAHLTRVAHNELRSLYSGAHAVVCPSRSEGFDLSGVEAMLCCTPVIASDIDVHRWVYADAAAYFATYDVASCADAIVRALSTPKDTGYLAELRHRGRERAALYSREVIGAQWAELFQRLAGWDVTPRARRTDLPASLESAQQDLD
jgi:glycosyltransferase involved in cell wall biosynthesis